jgi:hypothetical protein
VRTDSITTQEPAALNPGRLFIFCFHFLFVKKESGESLPGQGKSPRRLALRQIYRFLAKITGTTSSIEG